jgi:hypothetical protein
MICTSVDEHSSILPTRNTVVVGTVREEVGRSAVVEEKRFVYFWK